MLSMMLLLTMLTQTGAEYAPRVETLRFHVERLDAITVPEDLAQEKAGRMETLRAALAEPVADEEAFKALYFSIDETRQWLWEHAAQRPEKARADFLESETIWRVSGENLTLTVQRDTLAMKVHTPRRFWEFAPCAEKDLEFNGAACSLKDAARISAAPFHTGYGAGMALTLAEFPELPGFELQLTAQLIGNELVFDLAVREAERELYLIHWPKTILTAASPDSYAVIPRMQGMLLPGDWPQAIQDADLSNSRGFYLPWWGHLEKGGGVLAILETSDDAGGTYRHPSGGPTTIAPRWYASLGKMRYQRSIRYVFLDDQPTYVTLAKAYRRHVQERGRFVSLREKLLRTPALDQVIGKPVVHLGALYHFVQSASMFNREQIEANHSLQTFDQLREQLLGLKEKGVEAAYVHLDGWGYYGYDNGHPDVLPPGQIQGGWEGLKRFGDACAEIGYLFAVHDQYRDFYLNAASFDDRLAVMRMDGTREEHSVWCGGPQTILSGRFAPEYVRRNHDLFAAHDIPVRGAYLDVFSVVPLEESNQPLHPMTRSECARYRRECFDLLRARGYVVSSEEPAEYLVASLDLVHHGPYATHPHIGGGAASAIPVPLFNLVYHDSLLLPWEMGEDGGWGIPKGDSGRLHCLLNAGLPYLSPQADESQVAQALEAAALARRCGTLEMTDHRFLDDGRRKQQSTFADGTTVTVDFATGEYGIEWGESNSEETP